ncbi:MAG TPA: roadblock/LC7 domain-containing protein [Thermoplasmata archaeon]|nr:roadblock/LC7 domain-containing protein [Thermoplasmata archaeon]
MKVGDVLLDRLDTILADLRTRVRGIRVVVLSDPNGLPVAAEAAGDFDLAVVAAMATMIAQSADLVYENLRMSLPDIVVIEGKDANLAVLALSGGVASLLVVLEKNANLGLAKIEMRSAAGRLGSAFGVGTPDHPKIEELFILYENGTLIQHYSSTLRTDKDRDILGGMLTAVQAFVREALSAKDGTLDEMKYGSHSICFVRGTHTIAAAVVDGDTEGAKYSVFDALKDFEEKYQHVLRGWNGFLEAFTGIDECFQKVLRA